MYMGLWATQAQEIYRIGATGLGGKMYVGLWAITAQEVYRFGATGLGGKMYMGQWAIQVHKVTSADMSVGLCANIYIA